MHPFPKSYIPLQPLRERNQNHQVIDNNFGMEFKTEYYIKYQESSTGAGLSTPDTPAA
ncbi:hypothetical protein [Moorena producens]|uniref:hypothetical protein n=1 Tax=Moorena producens TaxID=1155739 RepID=UPI00131414BA|nr:hypothetical protein [Moorena producens]